MLLAKNCNSKSLLAFLLASAIASSALAGPPGVDEMLSAMKANDAQFDNVLLRCKCERVSRPHKFRNKTSQPNLLRLFIDDNVDKSNLPDETDLMKLVVKVSVAKASGQPVGSHGEDQSDELYWIEQIDAGNIGWKVVPSDKFVPSQKTLFRTTLGVRWPDFAVLRERILPAGGNVQDSKWASIGGSLETLEMPSLTSLNRDAWLHTKKMGSQPINAYQELILWQQFSLGFGFSKFITSIDKVVPSSHDRNTLFVTLAIWPDRQTKAELLVDSLLIVREATISANASTITTHSDGVFSVADRFQCARNGSYQRKMKDTQSAPATLTYTIESMEFDMQDSVYADLADMSSPTEARRLEVDHDSPDCNHEVVPRPGNGTP